MLLSEDSINIQYAIPIEFDYFEIFIRISKNIPLIPVSYLGGNQGRGLVVSRGSWVRYY